MKKSLQQIEDYYYRKGLRGTQLRHVTERDHEYKTILKQKLARLSKVFKIKSSDKKRYSMATNEDYEILGKIYRLEAKPISKHDHDLIQLIRTQLEHHWRTPIIKFLDKLLKKYHENRD